MKKVYEDGIQVVYEDKEGARITTLKKKPTHDFWGRPYDQPERLNPEAPSRGSDSLNSTVT